MKNIKLDNLEPIDIDRPDIIKTGYKPALTFKEVKDYFIKFLIQSEIPFSEAEKLYIMTKVRLGKTEDSYCEINNTNCYYTAICKLVDITVNNKPVYIVLLPEDYFDIDGRQRNKLIALRQVYNIVIFDAADWKSVGLDISGKEWLKPLTKPILRKLTNTLFKKINSLSGEVKSKYTLTELYKNIDFNTSDQRSRGFVVTNLKKENLLLKKTLYKNYLSKFNGNKYDNYDHIFSILAKLGDETVNSFVEMLNYILSMINRIDFRQTKYKELFMSKRKGDLIINQSKIIDLIKLELSKKYNFEIENLTSNFLRIYNRKTFQYINLHVVCNNRSNRSKIRFDSTVTEAIKNSLVFTLVLNVNKDTFKITNIYCYLQYFGNIENESINIGMNIYNYKLNKNLCLLANET